MLQRFFQGYTVLEGKAVDVDEIQHTSMALKVIQESLDIHTSCRRSEIFKRNDSPVERPHSGEATFPPSHRENLKFLLKLFLPDIIKSTMFSMCQASPNPPPFHYLASAWSAFSFSLGGKKVFLANRILVGPILYTLRYCCITKTTFTLRSNHYESPFHCLSYVCPATAVCSMPPP
jgi:hypothetical protein